MEREEIKEAIYDFLQREKILFKKKEHPPVFTVAEAKEYMNSQGGVENKNLFIRNDKKTAYYLLIMAGEKRLNINELRKELGENKLTFGKPNELMEFLQTTPGSVSPFGLIFDSAASLTVLVDEDLLKHKKIGFHPNVNTETLYVDMKGFTKFLERIENTVRFISV
jgi:Ala-tRNA(Pro) deacylase